MSEKDMNITLDLSKLAGLKPSAPRNTIFPQLEPQGTVAQRAIEVAGGDRIKAFSEFSRSGGQVNASIVGRPKWLAPPAQTGNTFCLGASGSVAAAITLQGAVGVFASTASPHFGFYASVGGGAGTSVFGGGGGEFVWYFGPPTLLKGRSTEITVGGGPGVYGTVSFYFDGWMGTVPNPRWIGIGIGAGYGGGFIVSLTWNYGGYIGVIK